MGNEIRIQPPSDQLIPGTTVIVPVTICLEKPLKVRGIHARFWGAEESKADYTTTSTNSKGVTTTHKHTAVQHNHITDQPHRLSGNDRLGFFGNMSDAVKTLFGGGQHDTLQAGEHPFQLEISIPQDAPPTFTGHKARVFYELSVEVDVPLAIDLRGKHSFTVSPAVVEPAESVPVRAKYPDDKGKGYFDAVFSPDVTIEMALVANQFRNGDIVDGIFCLDCTKPLNCRAIYLRFVGIEKTHAHGHTDQYVHQTEAIELSKPGTLSTSYKQEFSVPLKTTAPWTVKGKDFSIDWFAQIELDVPWAKDPKIHAPITVLPGNSTS